ncbi:YheC/YheD family protein [Saccharibacillus sp. CPCC 101409]|uniref:YheC/YheD family protein n=1 Tax=Saccharibacillus sp. CPCC 101409 TaxID=3058041 RepID=UPI00267317A6|nr:YheC/YheD family protein [Saccharibacillus sp. CPCC 101409]MDO3410555.1 YheC/YheD family protein [Saccharibacillus sp. CPCC 101409]
MSQKPLIGMMLGWKVTGDLMRAYALAADYYGAELYYFHTWDMKEDSIVGMQLEDNEWVRKEFRYPDVVYDNTRRRGNRLFENAYRRIEGIPIDHTLKGRAYGKIRIYNMIRKNAELKQHLIPFMSVSEPEKTLAFIEKHKRVILKPDGGAMGERIFTAELTENGIELYDQQYLHRLDREETLKVLDMLVSKKYCAQKMIRSVTPHGYPFHIRIHVSKNGQNQWTVPYKSVTLSMKPQVKITNSDFTYRGTIMWPEYLRHQFGEKENGPMDRKLTDYGIHLAQYLEDKIGGGFHELGLDLGVDSKNRFWLFEAGLGLPRTPYFQMQSAVPAVAYTLYVLKKHREQIGKREV